ncbi:hypothetical protein U8527_16380 [Kordia algicida OT-1]|uniref:Uncharacterized protein n=1 Tax=Kordia algicida OT-1 TaxID=391587 RepID=A9ECL2_9FLAO|nr:hypothetical protein [Kordia algicida]EDP94382.1 hypothetical protein KAOT1_10046 [Kordia algicida OT-1]
MKHLKQKFNLVLSLVTAFLLLPALSLAQNADVVEKGSFQALKTPIILVVALIVAIGLLFLIEKVVPRKVRPLFSVIFLLASVFFGYKIYNSIMAPVEFRQVKVKRYTAVINNLKDIRDAQLAHKTIRGDYAKDFNALESFIENAEFAIVEKRDSSYTEFDKVYKIDKLKEVVIIDTLSFRAVKDSLFKGSDRYKKMRYVPYAKNEKETFKMKVDSIIVNGYTAPVFKVSVDKDVILHDQNKDLLMQEKRVVSVDEVDGKEIFVGSLEKVSDSGNWPTSYEINDKNKKK